MCRVEVSTGRRGPNIGLCKAGLLANLRRGGLVGPQSNTPGGKK